MENAIKSLQEQFTELLAENKERILRLCSAYSRSHGERQDLFQEVLFQLWRSLPGFNQQAALSTWVYRVALNVCIRHSLQRSKRNKYFHSLKGIDFPIAGTRDDPIEKQEEVKFLYQCISRLNEIDKTIVLLYLEDVPQQEIADIVGISASNVGVRIHRLKKALFNCLQEKMR